MSKAPDCERDDCDPKRIGPITSAQNDDHPEADKKTSMKCEKCGKEWLHYF